jgi:large subunit ribosomal protein L9
LHDPEAKFSLPVPGRVDMKVVFLQEVVGTALPGEVKEVRDGFARNYLLPRGLAVPATKDALRRAEALAKREERRQAALDAEARRLVEQLEGKTVTITARVGEQGRLYGSVTAADIAEKLSELLGSEFDRRRILLPQPIRELGTRKVTLRLSRNVSYELPVEVIAEDGRRRTATAAEPTPATEAVPKGADQDEA